MPEPKLKDKKWKKSVEKEIGAKWRAEQPFKFDKKSPKKTYIIDTPPPYINAPIHIGHAATYAMQDMFARFHRMAGEQVIFPLGLDRNGLPIEVAAEKKFKVRLHSLPRAEAVKYCEKILEQTSTESIKSFEELGIGFTSWDLHTGEVGQGYTTDNPEYRSLTQDTFIELWNRGLIFFDKRINNYSPGLRTTIADSEIEYANLPTKFVHVKWKVKETGEELIIATTRPELIASCGMVIFNPDDERYKHLEGKTAILPLYEKEVAIKGHTDAEIDKGSGVVMMCSAGDYTDIRFFREQNIKPIISIDISGRMNENAGFLKGMKIKDAREEITKRLEEENLVTEIEHVTHRTPICERSKVPVEFIEMEELYLKQKDFLDEVRKIAKKINFYDPKSKHILDDWIDSVNIDWPISRRRFYATEIPLWYCKECNNAVTPQEKGKYWQPWKDACPIKECPKCKGTKWEGELRVLDTWFDSSISPLFNIRYLRDEEFFKNNDVCTLRPQGKEIVRTWLYYTLLRSYQLTGKAIFRDVWIHHHIVDENGHKFSKSLGNGIDPQEVTQQLGADAFRLWCVLEGNIHQTDLRCSFEKIKGCSKTLTKIWNISRFISSFESGDDYELMELDKWILEEANKLIVSTQEKFNKYDFHTASKDLRNFVWETFASHYLELVKARAYNGENQFPKAQQLGATYALNEVLKILLKLLAPIIPMITYKIYSELYEKDVHLLSYPDMVSVPKRKSEITTEQIASLNSAVWNFKRENGLSLKNELASATILEDFKVVEDDIKATHHIVELSYDKKKLFEGLFD